MVLQPVELVEIHGKQDRPSTRQANTINMNTSFDDLNDTLPSPTTTPAEHVESWKSPRINMYRVPVTFWAFLVMGMNDASYGALIPYLEEFYGVNYTVVSLVFLSPFVGYNLAALTNNWIHSTFGQRGVAVLGPTFHLISHIIIAVHPPYPVLVIAFMLAGLGNGIEDSGWNAWIGVMDSANEMLGFLHGFYGLGATISPLLATTMITQAGLPWYTWYYVMIGCSAVELGTSVHAFWKATGAKFREQHPRTTNNSGSRLKEAILQRPAARVTWLCALFFLGYVGVEVALGGWIVTFMIRVRNGEPFAAGITATGFWLGITIGRFVLGFITPRIGEKLAISIYLPLAMAMELLFWLVPQFVVSAVAVALQGFFLGPLFPAGIVAMTKLLPKHLHVSAIGFAAAFGSSGGAIFPFVVGVLAQAKGVQVLQPIILAILAVTLMLWIGLPRMNKKKD
ncbi:hypothetical protein AMS68_004548 [Peltaster fructicola]|uniref:Major facilitator superfamily (MFS) profile domain-containing protein n=1 Tax=Peltaster fructicola TaxID=286661 RepID=A0A6H0XWJ2_9PEZI|nr:hypothetical protein AMS68_004548 [Peltaster fructicola]